MQAVLVMFRSDGERRSFSLSREMTVLGRRQDCDLMIPLGEISRKHCRFIKEGDVLRLEDLGSSNGTFCNGRRVQEAVLVAGDTIQVGPVTFVLQKDGVPADDDIQPFSNAPNASEDSAAGVAHVREVASSEDSGIGAAIGSAAKASAGGRGRQRPAAGDELEALPEDEEPIEAINMDDEPMEVLDDEPPVEPQTVIQKPGKAIPPPIRPRAAAVPPPPPPAPIDHEDELDVIEDDAPLEQVAPASSHDEPLDVVDHEPISIDETPIAIDDEPIKFDQAPVQLDEEPLDVIDESPMILDVAGSLEVATPGEPVTEHPPEDHAPIAIEDEDPVEPLGLDEPAAQVISKPHSLEAAAHEEFALDEPGQPELDSPPVPVEHHEVTDPAVHSEAALHPLEESLPELAEDDQPLDLSNEDINLSVDNEHHGESTLNEDDLLDILDEAVDEKPKHHDSNAHDHHNH